VEWQWSSRSKATTVLDEAGRGEYLLAVSESLVALRDRREQVIARLTDGFARDLYDVDEYDRRIDLAHRAGSLAELDQLVADLGPAPVTSTALVPAPSELEAANWPARKRWIAIFGGVDKKGRWTVPRRMRVVAVMGGAEIDFREAVFAEGVTELKIIAMMGGVQLIVPPWLAVECDATAILGGFEEMTRGHGAPDPGRALLRVSGFCMMGGVSIETRLPGETSRQARKRVKQEQKLAAGATRSLPGGKE
jgi:hypothetical protein